MTSFPAFMDGLEIVQTSDSNSDAESLCVTLPSVSEIYVLYDSRVDASQRPDWLTGAFSLTEDVAFVSSSLAYDIWSRVYDPGRVCLGANGGATETVATDAGTQYTLSLSGEDDVQGAMTDALTLAEGSSSDADHYSGWDIEVTLSDGGTGTGTVSSYDSASRVIAVNWASQPLLTVDGDPAANYLVAVGPVRYAAAADEYAVCRCSNAVPADLAATEWEVQASYPADSDDFFPLASDQMGFGIFPPALSAECSPPPAFSGGSPDHDVMVSFLQELGDSSKSLTSLSRLEGRWSEDFDACSGWATSLGWKGVRCETALSVHHGRVVELHLVREGLVGRIDSLGSLVGLRKLVLSDNHLSGDLSVLSALPLVELRLERNDALTGSLASLSHMNGLQALDLQLNHAVTGHLRDVGDMPDLAYLRLSGCTAVDGRLSALRVRIRNGPCRPCRRGPSQWRAVDQELFSLRRLSLSSQGLDGNIWALEPMSTRELEYVDLRHNQLNISFSDLALAQGLGFKQLLLEGNTLWGPGAVVPNRAETEACALEPECAASPP